MQATRRRRYLYIYTCSDNQTRDFASEYPAGFYRRRQRRIFFARNRIFPVRLFSHRGQWSSCRYIEGPRGADDDLGRHKGSPVVTRGNIQRVIHSPRVATFFSALARPYCRDETNVRGFMIRQCEPKCEPERKFRYSIKAL